MPISNGIYYFENGGTWARPPVILIHGAGGNHLYWPPEVRRLKHQHIYALDLPGHGKSSGIGLQSIPDYAQSVLDFMQSIRINNAIFVGHSMGGAIALWLGIHHPEQTLGLGLFSTAARLRVSPALLHNSSVDATLPLAIKSLIDLSFSPQTDNRTKELATQRMAETRHTVLHGDFLACDSFDESSGLQQLNTPTLILCGADDQMTPPRLSEELQTNIPQSIFHLIEETGHMAMLEKPMAVANVLDDFLQRVEYLPGSVETK